MRLTRVHALVLLGAIATSAGLYGRLVGDHRTARPSGPALVVHAPTLDASSSPPESDHGERAMALAGASMSPADRRRILETMDYVRARLEARLSPLGTDFEDGDPLDELRRSLERHMPTFTAARELERGHWQSTDLDVRIVASCAEAELAAQETCFSLWNTGDGPRDLGRHARFLAWAASRAAVIDLGTRARAEACATALRARTSLESSTLGLVLLDDDLAMRPTPDRAEIQDTARRLADAMVASGAGASSDGKQLEAVATATPSVRVAPWLVVTPTALVVVPRLSAISDVAGFTKEIEAAAGADARWLHHP